MNISVLERANNENNNNTDKFEEQKIIMAMQLGLDLLNLTMIIIIQGGLLKQTRYATFFNKYSKY